MPYNTPTFRPRGAPSRQDQRREYDRHRRKAKPWRAFYSTPQWQARRAAQLTSKPVCERCEVRGVIVAATVAHHVMPHRGDWTLFITGELQSVCKPCHDSEAQAEEAALMLTGRGW
jgi:5-methylcytosine-specific restriction enzyme A